jgi:hypothetical protein
MKGSRKLWLGPKAGVASVVLGFAQGAVAQQNEVTAIDIALEPDATMIQHGMADNARLLKSFPEGFPLDETHHPHVTSLGHQGCEANRAA